MTYLAGAFLSGLALTALPVLIHLLARRRRKVVPWGAMQFLLGSPPRFRRRLLRLNELLVLLVRMLALAAIVLAFAQPVIPWPHRAAQRTEAIFILDTSLSTARRVEGKRSALEHAIDGIAGALDSLAEHDTAQVLLASDAPRWLTPEPLEITAPNRAALRAMLTSVRPTLGGSDLPLAIGTALQRSVARTPSSADVPRAPRPRIVVFSDATERPWRAEDTARWASLRRAAGGVRIESASTAPAPDPARVRNLSIDRLTPEHDTIAVGDEATLIAEVRNRGAARSAAAELVWRLDARDLHRTPLPPLEPGASTTLEYVLPCEKAGSFVASCALSAADDLPLDDSAFAALRVLEALPILVVDESPSGFLLAALGHGTRSEAKARSVFEPKIVAPGEWRALDLRSFACALFPHLPTLDAADAARLADFVSAGGGLWMALGERSDAAAFNRHLAATGLSPCRLAAPVGDTAETGARWRILPPDGGHPATLLLRDTARLDIDKARVARHFTIAEPVPPDLSTLLALETQAPLVVEHTLGRGHILLQTAPLDRAWSNLPILQAYVPMVREFVWWLAQGRSSPRHVAAGQTLRVRTNAADQAFTVEVPDGPAFSGAAKDFVARFSGSHLPGVHDLAFGPQQHELFTVARPPEESDLAPMSQKTRALLERHAIAAETHGTEAAGKDEPIAAWLLAAALALFLLEALLALLLTRQRQTRRAAVEMPQLIPA